jgi:hypothetical protein
MESGGFQQGQDDHRGGLPMIMDDDDFFVWLGVSLILVAGIIIAGILMMASV